MSALDMREAVNAAIVSYWEGEGSTVRRSPADHQQAMTDAVTAAIGGADLAATELLRKILTDPDDGQFYVDIEGGVIDARYEFTADEKALLHELWPKGQP